MKDTIPNLWKETVIIYGAVKQMIKDGYKEGKIMDSLAANIIDTLKRKRKLDFRTYELILNKVKAARPASSTLMFPPSNTNTKDEGSNGDEEEEYPELAVEGEVGI